MRKSNNAILLCSRGIDSVVTGYYIKKKLKYSKLIIMFFNYGQKTINQERKFSKLCAKNLKVEFIEVDLNWLGKISQSLINKPGKYKKIKKADLKNTKKESKKYYVPERNTIFLTYALALAESKYMKEKRIYDVFIGFKNEGQEHYPDTTPEFVKEINKLSKISCIKPFKIIVPLIRKDK